MKAKHIVRKSLSAILATGATISIGFLSFVGMYAISPIIGLCIAALVLAAAYEGQVNNEVISMALRRIFDENYTKKKIVRAFIEEQIERALEAKTLEDNIFLADYHKLKLFLAELEEVHHLNNDLEQKKSAVKADIASMEKYFFRRISKLQKNVVSITDEEKAIENCISETEREKLLKSITRKKILIRLSWIIALAGGVSSGFAALSAIQGGIATLAVTFTFLSVIPGGVLIALAVFGAVGYTLMFYQAMTDIIQTHKGKIKDYFMPRPDESKLLYAFRLVVLATVLGLGIFATVATAGTWWYATQKGALLVHVGDYAANMIRNISVPLMGVADLIYNISNSISAIDRLWRNAAAYLKESWNRSSHSEEKETAAKLNSLQRLDRFVSKMLDIENEDFAQKINPFRIADKALSKFLHGAFYFGHVVSMGVLGDQLDGVPDEISGAFNSTVEGISDLEFMPAKKTRHHNGHESIVLDVMFFLPITLPGYGLKYMQAVWDGLFSQLTFAQAKEKAFQNTYFDYKTHHNAPKLIPPTLKHEWNSSSKDIAKRLDIEPTVVRNDEIDAEEVASQKDMASSRRRTMEIAPPSAVANDASVSQQRLAI
jgi:hypothetical protein